MKEEHTKIIPAPYGFVICAVSTLIAGEELKKLSEFLELDGCGDYRTQKAVKLCKGAFESWKNCVFEFDKFRAERQPQIHEIKEACVKVCKLLTDDVSIFRTQIAAYMVEDDVLYEKTLSEMSLIYSLLNLSVRVCEMQIEAKETPEYLKDSFRIATPRQFMQNLKKIYKSLPCPDDFDISESEKAQTAMEVFCNKLEKYYIQYFTVENKNEEN